MGLVSRDDGWRLPDWLWERIAPLLPPRPPHPLGCHRPRVPDRAAMDAILLVLRTGMQWNALSATGICSSSSAHRRFQEWEQAATSRTHCLWMPFERLVWTSLRFGLSSMRTRSFPVVVGDALGTVAKEARVVAFVGRNADDDERASLR